MWCKPYAGKQGSHYQGFATGHSPFIPDRVEQPTVMLEKYATSLGAEFRYEIALVKLIKENGRVTGATIHERC